MAGQDRPDDDVAVVVPFVEDGGALAPLLGIGRYVVQAPERVATGPAAGKAPINRNAVGRSGRSEDAEDLLAGFDLSIDDLSRVGGDVRVLHLPGGAGALLGRQIRKARFVGVDGVEVLRLGAVRRPPAFVRALGR